MTDFAVHGNILLMILKDIYSDTTLAPFLGFKGGTAAMLFYGFDRNSVDLDFDLLDESKEEFVFEKIQKIAVNYGRAIDSKRKRLNLVVVVAYDQKSQNIKIEINRRSFGSKYELKTLLGISMLVIVPEDMFAHKLMAMHERMGKTNRDIYDVWFFLKHHWPINKEIVEKRSGMGFGEVLQKCAEQLEGLGDRRILSGLGEFFNEAQKDWIRAKLRTETIFLLRARLASEK